MKIGIAGGTFDPVHKAHLVMGETALSCKQLDKVIFIPTGDPYLKSGKQKITLPVHRYNMTALATAYNPRFEVSDMEIKRSGQTYTADTLAELHRLYPDDELYFLAGADSIVNMNRWVRPGEIFSLAHILAFGRADQVDDASLKAEISRLKASFGADIEILAWDAIDASSTEIREKAADGLKDENLPDVVFDYISEKGLYKEKLTYDEIKSRLRAELKPHRYKHTLGVADTARDMALCHGCDPEKAYLAGLLHDCGKPYADALSHAGKGAEIARYYYGISDEDILDAIRCHTIGNPEMPLLTQIIYLADMIEPGRNMFDGLDTLRALSYTDLNRATVMSMDLTRKYLKEQGKEVDAKSQEVYNYYKSLI